MDQFQGTWKLGMKRDLNTAGVYVNLLRSANHAVETKISSKPQSFIFLWNKVWISFGLFPFQD